MTRQDQPRRARPYAKLRAAMLERDLLQSDVAVHLRRSTDYVSKCIRGVTSWDMGEAYELMRWLGLPLREVYDYFPPDGYAECEPPVLKVVGG